MTSLHERLSKLERWKKLEAAPEPARDRRRPLLQRITDADLATLGLLNDEQWPRMHSHPDFLALRVDDAFTAEQGVRLAEIAKEVMS